MPFWVEAGYEETKLDEHDSYYYDDCGVDDDIDWLTEYIRESDRKLNFIWILNSENPDEQELYIELKHQAEDLPF